MEGFQADLEMAELFFRLCQKYNLKTEEQRVLLLRSMVKYKKMKYIPHPEKLIKGSVLHVKGESNEKTA